MTEPPDKTPSTDTICSVIHYSSVQPYVLVGVLYVIGVYYVAALSLFQAVVNVVVGVP